MAYYFAVETEKDNYTAINLKRCRDYSVGISFKYDEPFAYTLQEINSITTVFPNEEKLKQALLNVYSLKEEDIDKPLAIFYSEGIEKRLVKGKVLYEDSLNLIEDASKVIKYIQNKSKENDYIFFRQLSKTLSDDSISKSLVSRIASLIEKGLTTKTREPELDEINGLGGNIVTETAKLLIYHNHVNDSGTVSHTGKLNYENFHNLVSFISEYEQTLNKEKSVAPTRVRTKNTSV